MSSPRRIFASPANRTPSTDSLTEQDKPLSSQNATSPGLLAQQMKPLRSDIRRSAGSDYQRFRQSRSYTLAASCAATGPALPSQ